MRIERTVRTEHAFGRAIVDVDAIAKCVDQRAVAGQMREDAELDLRIVGGNQHVVRLGDKRAPDLAAKRRPNRNVLQVGIAAAQTAGRSDRLVKRGVHAAGHRINEFRQRVDVGAFQLLNASPLQHEFWDFVGERQFFQHADRRRHDACLTGALARLQIQSLEQHFRQLLW